MHRKGCRIDKPDLSGKQATRNASKARSNGKCKQGIAAGIHAQTFGADGVVTQRLECLTPRRTQQATQKQCEDDCDDEHHIVVGQVTVQAHAEEFGAHDVVDAVSATR